jgi:hypothetical protein
LSALSASSFDELVVVLEQGLHFLVIGDEQLDAMQAAPLAQCRGSVIGTRGLP